MSESTAARTPAEEPLPEEARLNQHQQRHLYFGLVHFDKLLTEIEAILSASSAPGLFPRYVADVSLPQRKMIEGGILRLRSVLRTLLASQGLEPDRPGIGAAGAIRTHLTFAEIAAEELGPSTMRGYGELTPRQSLEVEGVVAELRGRIAAMLAELSAEPAGRLESRIAALPASPARDLLAAMDVVTREYGLVEFRSGLALAVERLASPAMEIAVFGRVSCGKSSLLNYLLGADLLPTGITPITAVPTRVGYGAEPRLTARLERSEERYGAGQIPAQLRALASEEENPDNRLGVTGLTLSYPSPRLHPGVVFVDTPGLGSIRSWGAMATLAYLPRSDMAILLVGAGAAPGDGELDLLRWLRQGGVPVQVLVSKADLLSPADLEQSLAFLRRSLPPGDGLFPVRPISIRESALAGEWMRLDLEPLYGKLEQRSRAMLDRRLEVLRDGILAALGTRTSGGGEAVRKGPELAGALAGLDRQLRRLEAESEKVHERTRELARDGAEAAGEVIASLAGGLADFWQASSPRPDAETLSRQGGELLGKAMVEQGREAVEGISRLGAGYSGFLRAARQLVPELEPEAEPASGSAGEFAPRDLPMPQIGPLPCAVSPPGASWLGHGHVRAHLQAQLLQGQDAIAEALRGYGVRLQQALLASYTDLRRRFEARADIYRAAASRLSGGAPAIAAEQVRSPRLEEAVRELERWRPAPLPALAAEGSEGRCAS